MNDQANRPSPSESAGAMAAVRASFPPDFLWGAATAAYQIEGAHTEDGRGLSIWDTHSHTPGKTHDGDTGDLAVDHYHRVAEDVALMQDLGIDAYRFSISWSRLLPEGVGEVNPAGVAFYRDLCERLHAAGITPLVTLYHWDLPQALQDRGGWLSPESPEWFSNYAAVAKEHLGDLIPMWATLNEPWCSAFLGYSDGEHAPGGTNPGDGFVAAHHLMLAHHRAIAAMRLTDPRDTDRLGIVLNLIPAWPASSSAADAAAAEAADATHNKLFAEAVVDGAYPEAVLRMHHEFGLEGVIDPDELAQVRQEIDFLGVNYYNINRFAHVPGAPAPGPWPGAEGAMMVRPPGELTEMDWGVEPEGLTWVLDRVTRAYPHIPLYICENGAAYPDQPAEDGSVDDPKRIAYLEGHISALAAARANGADVRGYFLWSLLDNFEWARGYAKRFGVVYVDLDTFERTMKSSGYWYRDFILGDLGGS